MNRQRDAECQFRGALSLLWPFGNPDGFALQPIKGVRVLKWGPPKCWLSCWFPVKTTTTEVASKTTPNIGLVLKELPRQPFFF